MSFCIELFCVVTLQYQILVRIAIAYFIIEKKKAAPQPWQAIAQRFCSTEIYGGKFMEFFNSAVTTLQTIVVGLGGALCVWGGINLLEGYGQDNPASNAHV